MERRTAIAVIRDHRFTKELKRLEIETKFTIPRARRGALATLKAIARCFRGQERYIPCGITGGDKLITRVSFFVRRGVEYTSFTYRGARMVKVKQHRVLRYGGLPIFRNAERLLIDRRDFARRLHRVRHRFARHQYRLIDLRAWRRSLQLDPSTRIGEMVKTRVKDFILDTRDERVYAVAVTFCTSGDRVQRQLEVEYAGYMPGVRRRAKGSERQIIARTVELSKFIRDHSPIRLVPSSERKFDFVTSRTAFPS